MDETPVHPARIAKELVLVLKTRAENGTLSLANAAIYDEALTSSGPFLDYVESLGLHDLFYYGTPGPTLGAHGGSLGFQAAIPNGLVISLLGDGGADFNDAAFIVAARANMPSNILIDNGGYELVSANFARDARLRGENAEEQLAAGGVLPLHAQHPVHQNRAFQVRGFVSRITREPVFDFGLCRAAEAGRPRDRSDAQFEGAVPVAGDRTGRALPAREQIGGRVERDQTTSTTNRDKTDGSRQRPNFGSTGSIEPTWRRIQSGFRRMPASSCARSVPWPRPTSGPSTAATSRRWSAISTGTASISMSCRPTPR